MFSVTDQVLLRPLPYPSPERIVTLWETREGEREPLEVSPGNFLDWRARATSFEFIAGVEPWSMDYRGGSRPEVFLAGKVTAGFFESSASHRWSGRFFAPEEYQKGRDQVIVLQESFWRQRFGGDARIVGQALKFDDNMFTVVGIVPDTFEPRVLPAAAPRNGLAAESDRGLRTAHSRQRLLGRRGEDQAGRLARDRTGRDDGHREADGRRIPAHQREDRRVRDAAARASGRQRAACGHAARRPRCSWCC